MTDIQSGEDGDRVDLSEHDVRAMIRMLAEVASLNSPLEAKRQALLERMVVLFEADVSIWTTTYFDTGKNAMAVSFVHNIPAERVGEYAAASQDKTVREPYLDPVERRMDAGEHFTILRSALVSGDAWSEDPWVRKYAQELGMGYSLFSFFPIEGKLWSGMGLHRSPGSPDFSERQRQMMHLLFSEVSWLHNGSAPERDCSGVVSLSPRLRSVLLLLLDGQSQKEIASQLGLSVHTVRQYVKDLYKVLEVGSRGEFHRYFARGAAHVQLD